MVKPLFKKEIDFEIVYVVSSYEVLWSWVRQAYHVVL